MIPSLSIYLSLILSPSIRLSLTLSIYLSHSLSLSIYLSIYLSHSLSLSLSLSGFHFFCNRISTVRYLMSVRNTTREETHPQVSQLHHRTTAMAAKFRLHEECSLKSTIFLKKFVFLISFFFFFFHFFIRNVRNIFSMICVQIFSFSFLFFSDRCLPVLSQCGSMMGEKAF